MKGLDMHSHYARCGIADLSFDVTFVTEARAAATHPCNLSSLKVLAAFVFAIAAPSFAITYIVPPDRFEIERATAIVVGRVAASHVEASRFGIETVTTIALEESIKGNPCSVVDIHTPGGTLDGETRLVPGVPVFAEGERVLLFLYRRDDGAFTISDLGLGTYRFAGDIFVRTDIEGWDANGSVHVEQPRLAERFLNYVRGVVRGEVMAEDYLVAKAPLMVKTQSFAIASFTATSYMLTYGSGLGTRWNVFPSAVLWNQGNSETGTLGSGTAEINAAFSIWSAGGTNYVLAGANPNPNGFLDPTDGTNNIVFEKNLTSAGIQPFSCSSGGSLGVAGMTHANFGAGTHVFRGETFATTIEADVSMNQGVGACANFPSETFKSAIVHEVGHTLGFRHSDQNRALTASCAGDPTLDCSSSAIMNHILSSGLNGQLQAWDNAAVNAVYGSGPACTPPSITIQPFGATVDSGNSAQLSVGATGTAPLSYQWFIGTSGDISTPVNGGTTSSILVSPATTTSYWVRVTGACAPVANSNTATIIVTACIPPQILNTLHDQTVAVGATVLISLNVTGTNVNVSWFGNGNLIGFGPTLVIPSLKQTTQFRAHAANSCGSADSNLVTITVAPPRRRSVLH
ncbi:MAG TPA: M57 family metalloprotease [Thermoanaerobaculia bacterium]|nr:M57 family metalloprotease [Thermoanaerobaculia bacterium]